MLSGRLLMKIKNNSGISYNEECRYITKFKWDAFWGFRSIIAEAMY